MNPETAADVCAVCNVAVNRDHAFCRLYRSGGLITLCGSRCAEIFLRAPHGDNGSSPGGGSIEELVADWRWRERGE